MCFLPTRLTLVIKNTHHPKKVQFSKDPAVAKKQKKEAKEAAAKANRVPDTVVTYKNPHDPYYGDEGGFAATWDDVSAVAAALVAETASG